jgi:hypothetical protein
MTLTIGATLAMGVVDHDYSETLSATGGTAPYQWSIAGGSLPVGLNLNSTAGTISGSPKIAGTTTFTVVATDSSSPQESGTVAITLSVASHVNADWWRHRGTWLGILALGLPLSGLVWILGYAMATPGKHTTYLGVGMLTSLSAFVIGCLAGFLFGIPKVVSSGQARLQTSTDPRYAPSSNLAEVSDWLTKLLLGAGLVSLTKLGAPIGSLIDAVARGLVGATIAQGGLGSARVLAGSILFAYAAIGFLDGYVITTMWYQKKLSQQ